MTRPATRHKKKTVLRSIVPPPDVVGLNLRRLKFAVVSIDSILDNPLQAANRVLPSALKTLKENIVETKIITPPLVTPALGRAGTWVMVDGHRRRYVAKDLGVRQLQVAVETERAPEELFVLLNSGIRPFKGNTWLTCWALATDKGAVLKRASHGIQTQIRLMVEILGEARTVDVGKEGKMAPSFIKAAETLANVFREYDIKTTTRRAIAEWALSHPWRVIYDENRRMSKRIAQRFARCIAKNQPYPSV